MGAGMAQSEPRNAVNVSIQLVFAADNIPQRFPAFQVPKGLSVSLRGVSGSDVNKSTAFAGLYAEQLGGSGQYTISSDTEVTFPADNLCQIWCMGKEGDGLVASVRGSSVG
jgi:hypothetical protein